MSVHVNLSQYATELKDAYKSVIDKDNSINWILLGYAKGTNDLKVVGSGEDGLEELSEEFEDDKVLFAFTRVIDPNSNLPKYVFISWCGEGAPVQRKGLLPSHLNDVQKFLSGYHVQINARDSEDVTPEHILKKMDEGSGAKYSYHEQIRSKPPVPTPSSKAAPPPSLPEYKRSVQNFSSKEKISSPVSFKPPPASQSIQDRFLRQVEQSDKEKSDREKQEQFEKNFLARSNSSNKNNGNQSSSRVQNAREREEQELREKMELARSNRIQNPAESRRQAEEEEARRAEKSRQAEADRQNLIYEREQRELAEKEAQRKEELSREQERIKAEKLKQEREDSERRQQEARDSERSQQLEADRIQRERSQQEEADRIRKEKSQQEQYDRIQKEKQEKEQRQQEETTARVAQEKLELERIREQEAQIAKEKQEQEDREREELLALQAKEAEQLRYPADNAIEGTAANQETGSQSALTAIALFDYAATDETEVSLKEGEMVVNIVQIDEGWWQGTNESGKEGIFPANYVELVDNPPPNQEETPAAAESESTTGFAIALYDYQATEEGELSFAAADKITNIEFLSDDWWQGANPLEEQGLFPANYVELQQ